MGKAFILTEHPARLKPEILQKTAYRRRMRGASCSVSLDNRREHVRDSGGEALACVVEEGSRDLDDSRRTPTPGGPIPYSPPLEDAHLAGAERIATEITRKST
jgi:hypothetical protein